MTTPAIERQRRPIVPSLFASPIAIAIGESERGQGRLKLTAFLPMLALASAVHLGVRLRSYIRPMDRDAWIMAASLLARHGEAALDVVSVQLAALHRIVQMSWNADDAALLKFWRETAHAMLTISSAKSAGPYGAH